MKLFKRNKKRANEKQFLIDFLNGIKCSINNDDLSENEFKYLLEFWMQYQLKDVEIDSDKLPFYTLLGWYVDMHLQK